MDSPQSNRRTAEEDLLNFDLLESHQQQKAASRQPSAATEDAPLTSEEELLRDLFPEQADPTVAASKITAPATEFRASAELSSEAYVSLRSLEGLEELEDVAPEAAAATGRQNLLPEVSSTPVVNTVGEAASTQHTLLQLTRSVEQLTAVVMELRGTIQFLSQGLQTRAASSPDAAGKELPHIANVVTPPATVPNRRTWEPTPRPREPVEQWSERLEKFFDLPSPVPLETKSEDNSLDTARKLSYEILAGLNQHNMKHLEVLVDDAGVVTLKGRVVSDHLRYLATVVAQRTPGCGKVVNELVVSDETERYSRFGRYWHQRSRRQKLLHLVAAIAFATLVPGGYLLNDWLRPSVVPATGIVEIDGQPVNGARIVLHPVVHDGQSPKGLRYPTATTDSKGRFDFSTFRPHDGAPPGEYLVSIEWRRLVAFEDTVAPGPNLLPTRYLDPEMSGIRLKIARDSRTLPPITLNW